MILDALAVCPPRHPGQGLRHGRVDDPRAFDAMWDTVVDTYAKDPHHAWELNADGSVTSIGHPELCLDTANAGTANGTAIDVQACNGQADQQWPRA